MLLAALVLSLQVASALPSQITSASESPTQEKQVPKPRVNGALKGKRKVAVDLAHAWLVAHQSDDGRWDCDGFSAMCKTDEGLSCVGIGHPEHDVGVTGLAILALASTGNATGPGATDLVIAKGAKWLMTQQDKASGLVGSKVGMAFNYDHAIATLALLEVYQQTQDAELQQSCQAAVKFIGNARNPKGVWRYDVPPVGDSDTSVTGWMVCALRSAKDAGLTIDEAAFSDVQFWLDEVTDETSGRVGYSAKGDASARAPGINDHYPRDKTEAITAIGLTSRFMIGQAPSKKDRMTLHADLMLKTLPEWDAREGLTNDYYYWYFGTEAMYLMRTVASKYWSKWDRALGEALLDSQNRKGPAYGSWDPNGPWGHAGGRVYSTAMAALALSRPAR